MNTVTILITMPRKKADPTEYTYEWGAKAEKIARDLGYNTITIKGTDNTYNNATEAIKKHKPRFYVHFGHGCGSSLQGQNECEIVRKYTVDELICMAESPYIEERQRLLKLLNPLGQLSCPGICTLDQDPCSPLCTHPTNVNFLKGSIVFAVACHSASQLGKCAIVHGVKSYIGEDDLLMFPVDTQGSQNIFGEVQLKFFKELLMGNTVRDAEEEMSKLEVHYIKKYKKVKYLALPMLWNRIHRKILGDKNAMIYG